MPSLPELQAQVTGFVLIGQRIQGNQSLNFAEKQAQDALWLQAGLQLLAQLLAQLRQTDRACRKRRWLGQAQALQFGAVEVDRVDLGGRFHMALAPKLNLSRRLGVATLGCASYWSISPVGQLI